MHSWQHHEVLGLDTAEESSSYVDNSDFEGVESTVKGGIPESAKKVKDSNAWYDDTYINQLLQHYFPEGSDVSCLDALPLDLPTALTGQLIQQSLLAHLPDFDEVETPPFFLPLRFGENHWIGLYVDPQPGNPLIYWIDPYGSSPKDKGWIAEVLSNSGIFNVPVISAHILTQDIPLQQDGFNCGPWIIEIFRYVRDHGAFPGIGAIDINAKRDEHRTALKLEPVTSVYAAGTGAFFSPATAAGAGSAAVPHDKNPSKTASPST